MALYSSLALPAQTAGGATSLTLVDAFELSSATGLGISRVVVVPPPGYTTVTGIATNNATFNVRHVRAGSSLGTVATVTLAVGFNLTAEIPLALALSTTYAPLLQQDDVFDVQMVQNGTGIAIGAGLVVEVDVN